MVGNSTGSGKHLIILSPGFPKDESDVNCLPSIQGYVSALAKQIGTNNITIIAFQYPFVKGWYEWNGIKIYSTGGKNKRGIFRIITFAKVRRVLKGLQLKHTNIVVHSLWLTATAFLGHQFAVEHKFSHIASVLGQDATSNNIYLRLLRKKNLTIVCNSETVRDLLQSNYDAQNNIEVIPLGINPEMYLPTHNVPKKYDLIMAGSLTELKQPELFIELVKSLLLKYPALKAAIAGDGPMMQTLVAKVQQEHLQEHIEFLGAVPHPSMIALLQQARIFVHTSRYEASSHAILEAHYAGLPVVCFNVGFYPVENMTFPCRDLTEMINATSKLLATNSNQQPGKIPLINETVEAYRRLYGI